MTARESGEEATTRRNHFISGIVSDTVGFMLIQQVIFSLSGRMRHERRAYGRNRIRRARIDRDE